MSLSTLELFLRSHPGFLAPAFYLRFLQKLKTDKSLDFNLTQDEFLRNMAEVFQPPDYNFLCKEIMTLSTL